MVEKRDDERARADLTEPDVVGWRAVVESNGLTRVCGPKPALGDAATVWCRGASIGCVGLESSVTAQPSSGAAAQEFADFYRSRHRWAVRLAFGLTGDLTVAEDLVHDVFARMMPRYDSIDAPVAYLRTGIVNATTSRARRRQTERRHRPARPEPTFPSYLVEFADALNTLSVRERTVIVLRFLEGLDDGEIAREMRCPQSTVRSLVHRGLGKLRREISS